MVKIGLIKQNKTMLENSISNLAFLYAALREMPVEQARVNLNQMDKDTQKKYRRKDSKDTVGFDVLAEKIICYGDGAVGHYPLFRMIFNKSGIVITEEQGKVGGSDIQHDTPVIISDPTDRSSYLEELLEKASDPNEKMGTIFDIERERIGEDHARVEAPNASVTFLKDNDIIYSIILNLLTAETFVAFERGVFSDNISNIHSLDDLTNRVRFHTKESDNLLCYCKGEKYDNNYMGARLRFFPKVEKITSPGGPNRFTYLLRDLSEDIPTIGLIAHNGEKIQESLPNIAVAYFSNDLAAFKLFCDRDYAEHRAGKYLTPNLQNSIYMDGTILTRGIEMEFLNNYEYPSEFRDTTIIVPIANDRAMTTMDGMVYRETAIRIV